MYVYFSLGTNLGDKEHNLRLAVQKIKERIGKVISLSAFYATAPWGFSSVGGVYSDRLIDIDLLLYDDRVMDTPELKLPHPLMHERRFVMESLVEIAPDLVHPVLKKKMRELL